MRTFLTRCTIVLVVGAAPTADAQRTWVRNGPGPNTLGQVEGITDRQVVGAIHTVATHPTDANVLYVGAVNGGIWRTGNALATSPNWTSQLGITQSHSMGAIAFDPTDATNLTLLAGSGRFSSLNSLGGDRVGVFRTTDGGTTWNLIAGVGGTVAGLNVSGVAPRGATLVVSSNNANAPIIPGVWRSVNTGAAWTRISGAVGTGLPFGASFDLASDPSNNNRLFTNAGANGIYRSDDAGATWAKVSTAAVDGALANVTNLRISVGASNNVYVAIVNNTGRLNGLFRSGDGGTTWTALDLPATTESGVVVGTHPGNQGGTHLSLAADRTNANVVYVGGDRQPHLTEFTTQICPCWPNSIGANDYSGRLFRVNASLAAGAQAAHITHTNTSGTSSPHADSRDMAMDANGNLIESDDGGVYRRTTPLVNTGDWFSANGDIQTTEFHSIAWDAASKMVIGGAQDTGTPEQSLAGNARWRSVSTADGGQVSVDDTGTPNTSVRYSSNQNLGSFRRRTVNSAGVQTASVLPALTVVGGGAALVRQFYTPVAVNNATPARLIIGGRNNVYESLDQGATITAISANRINACDGGVSIVDCGRDPIGYGATGNAEWLYFGTGDQVFVRNAAGVAPAASGTYPGAGTGRRVVDIAINPANGQVAFVADTTNVYRTADGGGTWTNITGDLATQTPGAIRAIAFSSSNADGSVIVGTNNGAFIARGTTFLTWTPVGTGLPRAPVYDLEYDATDEILVAGVLGRGAWTTNLDERDPVDLALVLDLSGSMLSPACSTCAAKLQVLKDAVEIFVQLWTVVSAPDDRFGLNYFRTNISELLIGGNALFATIPNAAAVIADVQSQTTVGSNLTAMGGGIQTAINRLTTTTRPRNIIVFTDGMQNVNPMVNTTTFEIAAVAGRPNSNVSATTPATDLNTALGIKVSTIGVGATPAFVDLLDDIASETNGLFKQTTAPDDDLRRFYVEELVDVLKTFSPQLVAYRRGSLSGDTTSETFTTNASARKVVLKVSWRRGASMRFSVLKDGVDVTRAGRTISGQFYQIWTVNVPATSGGQQISPAGSWRVRIAGTSGAPYEAAAIVDEISLKYDIGIGGTGHTAGTPLPLNVRVTVDGQPVSDAQVTARVLAPRQSLATLLSTSPTPAEPPGFQYESGATAAQRKFELLLRDPAFHAALQPSDVPFTLQNNANGTYSGSFANTATTGVYRVVFRITGQRPDIGAYDRTETRAVTVTFGAPALAASNIQLVSRGRVATGEQVELIVRPVDNRGNFLGPDYGHAIAVTVNGTLIQQPPIDRLDGSYAYPLVLTQPRASTTVDITVMRRPLFSGTLASLPTQPPVGGQSRFALSAHAGVAIPASGFPSAASSGLLLEADLEWRVAPSFSLEAVFGRYDFGAVNAINGGTLSAKGYTAGGPTRLYGALGGGAFRPSGGSTDFGLSASIGVNRSIATRLELDAGAGYSHVFASTAYGFVQLRAGVKVTF